jgi:ankyrin repeat protein
VATLLEHGADPNARTDAGDSPFHYLAKIAAQPDLPAWANQAASLLIDAGADAVTQNSRGFAPLHFFALSLGFGGMAPTRSERVFAVEAGRWEQSEAHAMLALLVSLTPDIDSRNSDGLTALQLALRLNHMLTADYLVAHGADALTPDANGVTARDRIDRALGSSGWKPTSQSMEGTGENR